MKSTEIIIINGGIQEYVLDFEAALKAGVLRQRYPIHAGAVYETLATLRMVLLKAGPNSWLVLCLESPFKLSDHNFLFDRPYSTLEVERHITSLGWKYVGEVDISVRPFVGKS